ncbi:MAG: carbohydrate kinase family protein [Chloroflexota bacterium]
MKKDVIGIGAMNLDRLYRVDRVLEEGETGRQDETDRETPTPAGSAREEQTSAGGSAANTIYGLAKLGIGTGFVGAVGNDPDGQKLVESLQTVGVDTSNISVKDKVHTGSAICLVDNEGRRAIYVSPGANTLLTKQDFSTDYLSQANIIHLSSLAGEEPFRLAQDIVASLPLSVTLSFAPGALYTAKGINSLKWILKRTNLLFTNREEMEGLTGLEFSTGAQKCLDEGCRTVVVTLGAGIETGDKTPATCYIRNEEQELFINPPSADKQELPIVDTTGAGDAFIAGFLFGMLRGKELEECGLLGNLVARFCITMMGAREGLPSLDELTEKYSQLYNRDL